MSEPLRVLIIGAGTKGALYPEERLTHAHAFSRNGFELLGFYDTNFSNASKAANRWNTRYSWNGLDEAFDNNPDVVTVAVSDESHFSTLLSIAQYKPKLVFTEKPFCQNLKEAKTIANLYKELGIELSVNFTRRFLPKYQNLKVDPDKFISGHGWITKGLHNLCHLADLAVMLNIREMACSEIKRSSLNVFEADLFYEDQKISFLDHGSKIFIIPTNPRSDYQQDTVLNYGHGRAMFVDLSSAMELAARNIREHLLHGEPLISTVENALRVMEVCDQWQH